VFILRADYDGRPNGLDLSGNALNPICSTVSVFPNQSAVNAHNSLCSPIHRTSGSSCGLLPSSALPTHQPVTPSMLTRKGLLLRGCGRTR